MKHSDSGAKFRIRYSIRDLQYAQSGDQNHEEEEKSGQFIKVRIPRFFVQVFHFWSSEREFICFYIYIDIENLDGSGHNALRTATSQIEGDEEEQGKDISEDESEEETSQMNSMFSKQLEFHILKQIVDVEKTVVMMLYKIFSLSYCLNW